MVLYKEMEDGRKCLNVNKTTTHVLRKASEWMNEMDNNAVQVFSIKTFLLGSCCRLYVRRLTSKLRIIEQDLLPFTQVRRAATGTGSLES